MDDRDQREPGAEPGSQDDTSGAPGGQPSRGGRVARRIRDWPEGPGSGPQSVRTDTGARPRQRVEGGRTPAPKPDEKRSISPWAWILLAGVVGALLFAKWTLLIAILGLALLITVHEFGHFIAAKMFGMRVEKFYVGFPPALWRHTRGETEYGVGVIPLGGFCRISGMSTEEDLPPEVEPRAYYNQPVWKRNIVIAAGPFMNIFAAAVIMFVFLLAQGTATPTLTVEQVVKGSPAGKAGLVAGDRLVGGRVQTSSGQTAALVRFKTWDDATAFFRAHPDQTVRLSYVKKGASAGGEPTTVSVQLARSPQDTSVGYLGVAPTAVSKRPPPWTAAWLGVRDTGEIVVKTFQGFWWLMSGKVAATGDQGVTGPVGIVKISSQAVQQNWYPVLLAFISVNLGIINLIPILPFDGGHIFFNTVERIRGRKTSTVVIERAATVGALLLLVLFVFLTFNDIKHILG
jgi:regulator of sigma E protease